MIKLEGKEWNKEDGKTLQASPLLSASLRASAEWELPFS
jgi:hypothetical protein